MVFAGESGLILGQDILRLLTVKALRGRTWAGMRVFDSPAKPADLMIEQERAAFIGVYTDEADHTLDGQSFHNPESQVYLLIECATADRITVPGKPNGPSPSEPPAGGSTITISQTDEALELIIGLLARQAVQALLATDNIWSELWRLFCTPGRSRVETRRGGPGQQAQQSAVRYASRVMRMQLTVLADPVYGEAIPEGFWKRFFEAIEADTDDLAHIAPILRAHFETNPLLASWRIEQKRGTYTFEALRSLGITPLPQVIPDEQEPPLLTMPTVEQMAWGRNKKVTDSDSNGG